MIDVCAEFGVHAERVKGRSGVWLPAAGPRQPERKIGAVGIRVSQNVTMHGFALNANCDLSWGTTIVPCGITDAGITSLTAETGLTVTPADLVDRVERAIVKNLPPFPRPADVEAAPSLSF
ncbi:ribose-phosphate pyrophosphokinase [Platysternon megacephalum]|uniref:lipoyl(octanoyl) transferase n=1 Tax=Platysternon megacephalum TaxID=55544 RepID=A0A4D9DF73_9SAUR|nr:ribose-phosphate pyrophosphokinase [Platysternon megacephalum]